MIIPKPFVLAVAEALNQFPLSPDNREIILSVAEDEAQSESPALTIQCNGTSVTVRGLSPTLSAIEDARKEAA